VIFPALANTGAAIIDWLAQPSHGELDILGLQLPPAFDLGPVLLLREPLEIVLRMVPGGRALLGEFLADERVSWHRGGRLERAPMIPPIRPGGKPLGSSTTASRAARSIQTCSARYVKGRLITSTTGSRKSSGLPEIAQPRAPVVASQSRAAFQLPFLQRRARCVHAVRHRRGARRQARIYARCLPQILAPGWQPKATLQLDWQQ